MKNIKLYMILLAAIGLMATAVLLVKPGSSEKVSPASDRSNESVMTSLPPRGSAPPGFDPLDSGRLQVAVSAALLAIADDPEMPLELSRSDVQFLAETVAAYARSWNEQDEETYVAVLSSQGLEAPPELLETYNRWVTLFGGNPVDHNASASATMIGGRSVAPDTRRSLSRSDRRSITRTTIDGIDDDNRSAFMPQRVAADVISVDYRVYVRTVEGPEVPVVLRSMLVRPEEQDQWILYRLEMNDIPRNSPSVILPPI